MGPTGGFATAAARVRDDADQRLKRAQDARVVAQELRTEASLLCRHFEQLKRRRLEHEADNHDTAAAREEADVSRLPSRLNEYKVAYTDISSGARDQADAPPVVTSRPKTNPRDLPPGTVANTTTVDCTVNFQEWLEARDLTSVQDSLISEMFQDLVGEVAKPRIQNSSRCSECSRDLILDTVKALLVCPTCGIARPHLDATPSCVAYDEGGRREMFSNFTYTYKRSNHMFERIAQMMTVTAAVISDELMEMICVDLHQRRVSRDNVTAQIVKDILKKHKKRKAYEFVVPITRRLQGHPPIQFTRETLEKLKRMFEAIQRPFERHCPQEQTNFLSYWYVIYKFLELLGAYDVLPYLTLLKGKPKLQKQDAIWKKICADLGWEFIPSI
jgi:hypothetical protein